MLQYICDICGKPNKNIIESEFVLPTCNKSTSNFSIVRGSIVEYIPGEFDLCQDCAKKIAEYIESIKEVE